MIGSIGVMPPRRQSTEMGIAAAKGWSLSREPLASTASAAKRTDRETIGAAEA